jgi:hypothetical protein
MSSSPLPRDDRRDIIPFVPIEIAALVVLWFVPGLATALPHALYSHGLIAAPLGEG